ncbi:hypothetical protein LJC14_06595 [Treponema sp. OttesenSCG-928-L16]|nr:hypothetical protein [Treponema sp. OttesenSCG-928-L16]
MNEHLKNHPFWGLSSPLSSLSCLPLMIIASGRLAFALIAAGALLWVFGLSCLVYKAAGPVLPRKGISLVMTLLSSFTGSLFFMLFSLISPILALETAFMLVLVPISCVSCGIFSRVEKLDTGGAVTAALLDALIIGLLIIALALIREPFGYGSLSVPAPSGLIEIITSDSEYVFSVRTLSASGGALILLGYAVGLFRSIRQRHYNTGNT